MPPTLLGSTQEEIPSSFQGYVEQAYKANGVVFACIVARQLLFSEARFQFRRRKNGRPGELFGTEDLAILEKPWYGATTGDLLTRAMLDADTAGNFFGARRPGPRIQRMRPDWVTIILGSHREPKANIGAGDLDAEVLGYVYQPGGRGSGEEPVPLLREEVVHWAPLPDPLAVFRGMSWLEPIRREIMGDQAAITHKLKYFENGASPNLVVSFDADLSPEAFKKWLALFAENHEGVENAYKTLILAAGAKAEVVGSDMKQIDFKSVQAIGENRIAVAARVPGIIVGLSEGLESATYSNFGQARRAFADLTMRPLWRSMSGAFESIVRVPEGAELWYDPRDISFLQEDEQDKANIQQTQAQAIKALTESGYDPQSAIDFVVSDDLSRLTHSGMYSVQLQALGASGTGDPSAGTGPPSGE